MRSVLVTIREAGTVRGTTRRPHFSLAIISVTVQLRILVFWVRSVYFNVRNILPKSGTFPLGHPVYNAALMGNWIPTFHRNVLPSSWKCRRSQKNLRRFSGEMHGLVGPGHCVTLGPTIRTYASAILWASPEQNFIKSLRRCCSTYKTKFPPHIVPPHVFFSRKAV